MRYNLDFTYCAILLFLLVLFAHMWQRKTRELHNQAFTWLVVCGLLSAVINVLNASSNMGDIHIPFLWLNVLNYTYFIALNANPFVYALYTQALTRNRILNRNISHLLRLFLPVVVEIALLYMNAFNGCVFYYDEQGIYQRGDLQIILYLVALYYGLYGIRTIICKGQNMSRRIRNVLCLLFGAELITSVIQGINPHLLVQTFGMALCETLLLLTMQQTDGATEPGLEVFNAKTFDRIYQLNLQSDRNMSLILMYTEEHFLRQSMGIKEGYLLHQEISTFLDSLAPRKAYYLGRETYAIMLEQKDMVYTLPYMNAIHERFRKEWEYGENKLQISYRMMRLEIPKEVVSLDTFYTCLDSFRRIKRVEKNTVLIDQIDVKRASRKILVENSVRHAIKAESFEVFYQPIYSCKENKVVSAEALVRLKDAQLGYIPPDEFIPIAEKNGMVIQIGEIVLKKACQFIQSKDFAQSGLSCIEVNLSVVQCMQKDLASRIIEIMAMYQVKSNQIQLEITETAAVASPQVLLHNMRQLHEHGISFALDDFGTGYSNINSMVALPLHTIKFDRTMIEMATESDGGQIALKSSAAMVKQMGMCIVAEGAETREQVELLKQCEVDYIQGFYYARPLPTQEFLEYIEGGNYGEGNEI